MDPTSIESMETANEDVDFHKISILMIPPSSHIGSSYNMFELFQDSMAITRFHQHPNIFGTITANSNCIEIQETLFLGQIVAN